MSLQGPFKINSGEVFPHGCGVVSSVSPLNDYDTSTKEHPVQARDKDTGTLMWQVDVMDFDPDARERTFRVKVVAEVQPVPPDAIPGTPVRPVVLENLSVTPYVKDGKYPKVAYSLKCSGLGAARRPAAESKAA